ncbi:WecB/TagA/CpsF family glycosyltransferase [Lichenicoccus sp.]|uniref:WecB/TagA/CpsF family glycosyltransferase n=1 Tax=Lichenicoccus sp. TaxID=2781899 RepID=UPI003D11D260
MNNVSTLYEALGQEAPGAVSGAMPVAVAPEVPTRRLLGLDFADLAVTQAASWIARRPQGASFGYVVTPNADHLVRLSRVPALLPLYRAASMCLLDSRVVARVSRILGLPAPCVTPGSDLTEHLLREHLVAGERVTIIGLRRQHLAALVARTGMAAPAHYDPPIGFDQDPVELERAVRFVIDNPARYVFLAVGSPRQERLADAIAASGRATGTGLCIGASLDFVAGAMPRAPGFMQRMGIEWLHRMLSDPRRLARRYLLDNPPIFWLLWRERRRGRSI